MSSLQILIVAAVVVLIVVAAVVLRSRGRRAAPLPPPGRKPEVEPRREAEPAVRAAEGRAPAAPAEVEAGEAAAKEAAAKEAAAKEAAAKEAAAKEAAAKEAAAKEAAAKEAAAKEAAAKEAAAKEAAAQEARAEKKRRVETVRKGLQATRGGLVARLSRLFQGKKELSPELLASIEEVLITSDVGARTTDRLVARVKEGLSGKDLSDERLVWEFLREEARAILGLRAEVPPMRAGEPYVILVLGVNGVGKTTTIGKLASRYKSEGKSVLLAAADTFRAAAVQQLQIWGRRVPCEVVSGKEGADPSSVAFAAIERAKADKVDVVIVDTAGRLHTKVPLMDELKKIHRVVGKAQEGAPHEVLLVLDANTGQNAIQQAATFREAVQVTGIVLTKLDGTAKGGVILGICDEQKIPVRFIGVGEGIEDLRPFEPDLFVSALFDDVDEVSAAA
ncbi:MAG: signal recognition particle-docking protein FtsY [Myxococcales bacterium]|nr:signal recognition particle-docking protein FtsY [Myxococcales bacterium]